MSNNKESIETSLTRKLLLRHHPTLRISNDVIVSATGLLRIFIVEARHRASVEAECEAEASLPTAAEEEEFDAEECSSGHNTGKRKRQNIVEIRGEHIVKVAADMLLDFS